MQGDHSLHIAMMKNLYTSYGDNKPNTESCCCDGKSAFYSTLLRLANSYGIQRDDGIYIDIALTNQEVSWNLPPHLESLTACSVSYEKKIKLCSL